ncbi:MAG TPA: F0F1 ATP synthase subunit A [Planctomycetota bacterium]|nr:F0F1 ATP synthase subunit A [Planctomycetota bacterium]
MAASILVSSLFRSTAALAAFCGEAFCGEALHGEGAATASANTSEGAQALPEGAGIFTTAYSHVIPHRIGPDLGPFSMYNVTLFQIGAVVLMFLLFSRVKTAVLAANTAMESGQPLPKQSWLVRVFSGFVLYIRDEMVLPILGEEDTKKYLGHFLFVFFFIMFMNVGGLIPFSQTPTASIYCTLGLAITTFVLMIAGGIQVQGAKNFFLNLVPHGLPKPIWPIMFLVELIGLIVKPVALTIRLFATMLAGHLVVLSFICLILYFRKDLGNGAYAIGAPGVALGVFIMVIESFITLLQAYIFTYLSILFIGMCRHPEH